jgi:hypothetical protein
MRHQMQVQQFAKCKHFFFFFFLRIVVKMKMNSCISRNEQTTRGHNRNGDIM